MALSVFCHYSGPTTPMITLAEQGLVFPPGHGPQSEFCHSVFFFFNSRAEQRFVFHPGPHTRASSVVLSILSIAERCRGLFFTRTSYQSEFCHTVSFFFFLNSRAGQSFVFLRVLGRVARQRLSRFTAKVAESPPVSCKLSPRCTDVPDWVTTSAVQATFWG